MTCYILHYSSRVKSAGSICRMNYVLNVQRVQDWLLALKRAQNSFQIKSFSTGHLLRSHFASTADELPGIRNFQTNKPKFH